MQVNDILQVITSMLIGGGGGSSTQGNSRIAKEVL